MRGLGDTDDPRSQAYADEQAAAKRKEAEIIRKRGLSDAQRAAEEKAKRDAQNKISQLNVNTLKLNNVNPATLPLSVIEENFRKASLAGDFDAMNKMMPFGIHRWNEKTPLGKYRFNIVNGKKQYVPFTDADFDRFMAGPWLKPFKMPAGWVAPLIEPGADLAACQMPQKLKEYKAAQKVAAQHFPADDWRHVLSIFPGTYICQVYRPSTWVKIRGPVLTAIGAVAATYLGPVVMEKISGSLAANASGAAAAPVATSSSITSAITSGVTTGAGAAAGASAGATISAGTVASAAASAGSLFSQIQTTGNKVLGYVNKANTIKAIANGEIPPPPLSIEGDSFADWATQVATKELEESLQRKLVRAEEERIRKEVEQMQAELARLVPPNTPTTPSPRVPAAVQEKTAEMAINDASSKDNLLIALAIGIPALALLT